jgi:hypothetical protein
LLFVVSKASAARLLLQDHVEEAFMRRSPVALLLAIAILPTAEAQKAASPIAAPAHATQPHAHAIAGAHDTDLPVTRVSLYKNGVGFFEHTGTVTGNAAVTLSFTSSQLNDVLQSLTAIDLNGGRISGAEYNSTTPLDQQLKSLSLGLPARTTIYGLFNALRGSRVEVLGSGSSFSGRIVDIESHKTGTGKDQTGALEGRFLTVASDSGEVRIFQVTPTLSVRLLDTAAHADLTQYLQLLDSNRNQGLRHLTLQDNGTGTRELHLSYISDVPIWKSTYRILLTNAGASSTAQAATLQGWSVVDNTTGADWINVHLALIAGTPQSFIQALSQPIYSRRPEVPIAQDAQLTPQTHDSSVNGLSKERSASSLGLSTTEMRSRGLGMAAMAGGAPGGVLGGIVGGTGYSIGAGHGSNIGGGISYEDSAEASIAPSTHTAAFDDFFAYNLTEPVTILKNESALVPILQAKVDADSVTLASSNGFAVSQPLRALWITNTSGLTLDRGSFSIVEDGNFGGEGLLDTIHPGEKRLLSYAADQAVHVDLEGNRSTQHLDRVTASKGVLQFHHAELHEITYVVHNAAAEPRTVVLEEPVVSGFVLDSETPGNADPRPTETTPTVYRFRLRVAAGDTVRLHTGATRRGATTYRLTDADDSQLTLILNEAGNNAALEAALQPILDARRRVAGAQTAVDQTNARLTELRSDEERQRANITALQSASKGSRDRFVAELNKTEDAITAAQAELATRSAALDAARADLSNRIASFQIDEAI